MNNSWCLWKIHDCIDFHAEAGDRLDYISSFCPYSSHIPPQSRPHLHAHRRPDSWQCIIIIIKFFCYTNLGWQTFSFCTRDLGFDWNRKNVLWKCPQNSRIFPQIPKVYLLSRVYATLRLLTFFVHSHEFTRSQIKTWMGTRRKRIIMSSNRKREKNYSKVNTGCRQEENGNSMWMPPYIDNRIEWDEPKKYLLYLSNVKKCKNHEKIETATAAYFSGTTWKAHIKNIAFPNNSSFSKKAAGILHKICE